MVGKVLIITVVGLTMLTGCGAPQEKREAGYFLDAALHSSGGRLYLVPNTNLKLSTENYGGSPVPGEGHIHFYLDGKLVGPIVNLEPYPLEVGAGNHRIKLTLAENNHAETFGVVRELDIN